MVSIFIIFLIFLFIAASFGINLHILRIQRRLATYNTDFIKGAARGYLGMFYYKSVLEENRAKLDDEKSKF